MPNCLDWLLYIKNQSLLKMELLNDCVIYDPLSNSAGESIVNELNKSIKNVKFSFSNIRCYEIPWDSLVVVFFVLSLAWSFGIIDVLVGNFNDGVWVGQESIEFVESWLDFLESIVSGADWVLEGLSFVLEICLQGLEVWNLFFILILNLSSVSLVQLILSLLESGDESGDEVEDVVEGLGVDLGAHFNESLNDRLEKGEGGLLAVWLKSGLDLSQLFLSLDQVHLGFLWDLNHWCCAFGSQVHQESLGLFTGVDGIGIVSLLGLKVGVLWIDPVSGLVLWSSISLECGGV